MILNILMLVILDYAFFKGLQFQFSIMAKNKKSAIRISSKSYSRNYVIRFGYIVLMIVSFLFYIKKISSVYHVFGIICFICIIFSLIYNLIKFIKEDY